MSRIINKDILDYFDSKLDNSASRNLISNSIRYNGIENVSFNKNAQDELDFVFSHELPFTQITNQEKSGRCWLFAALNTIRQKFILNNNLNNFEFSQSWLMFWDKLEKSNYFLETMLDLADKDIDDRSIYTLLSDPIPDGGQWDMYVALIEKYGIVPKNVFPETFNSKNTALLNFSLATKLRQSTALLRRLKQNNIDEDKIIAKKKKCLSDIYNMLVYSLGKPVEEFTLEFTDKNNNFISVKNIKPIEFYREYVNIDLSNYISIINSPNREYKKTYTIEYLGNVFGSKEIKYLNLPIEKLEEYSKNQILDNEPVWFGCDMGKYLDRQKGILHGELFDLNETMATCLDIDKAKRLELNHSKMTHAMVFIGMHLNDGNVNKWKVENSWGKEVGKDGIFIMNKSWFDDHVFQVVINKKYLSKDDLDDFNIEPIVLPIWDPMGSLA